MPKFFSQYLVGGGQSAHIYLPVFGMGGQSAHIYLPVFGMGGQSAHIYQPAFGRGGQSAHIYQPAFDRGGQNAILGVGDRISQAFFKIQKSPKLFISNLLSLPPPLSPISVYALLHF